MVFFDNPEVEPPHPFEYDAVYRLIGAQGREQAGRNAGLRSTTPTRRAAGPPNDGQRMRNYTERYELRRCRKHPAMAHEARNGNWTRRYATDGQQPPAPHEPAG